MGKTFKHSGDLGDVIYALPTIRALGGGVLYLDPQGGLSSPLVKWAGRTCTKLNAATIESVRPLLSCQPYLNEVRQWKGEPVDFDLDQFRLHLKFNNLSDSHLAAFNLPLVERDRAWITVDAPVSIPNRPIVIARSLRYHGNDTFWESILPEIKTRAVFVGLPKEHEIFVYTFNHEIPHWPTADIMALTRVLAGCEQFIGNQGLPHAIAEALKKNLINEVFRPYPAAVFQRPGAQYV